jgi:hypothetical protein
MVLKKVNSVFLKSEKKNGRPRGLHDCLPSGFVLLFPIRRGGGEVRRMSEMKDDVVEQSGVVRVVTSDAPHRCLIGGCERR